MVDRDAARRARDALLASHAEEKREHEAAIGRLRTEYDRLQSRMHAMYVDKLDGKVDAVFFDRNVGRVADGAGSVSSRNRAASGRRSNLP